MNKKLTKTDKEFQMFTDFWLMYQEFYTPTKDDQYWDDLATAVMKFYEKYPCQFAVDITVAYMKSREKIYRDNG